MSKFNNASLLTPEERVSDEQLIEEAKILQFSRNVRRMDRRTAITSLVAGASAVAGLGLAGCSDNSVPTTTPTPTTTATPVASAPSVVDVLNFALNLEYLEASFYAYVYTGGGLSSTDLGGTPTITGGAKYTFSSSVVGQIAQNLYAEEQAHVQFLRSTIQSAFNVTPAACPSLTLNAMGSITSDAGFISLARQLETVGVSAYAGGAQYLTSSAAALTYAAQILHVEAQHAGLLRQLCIQYNITTSTAVDSLDTPPSSSAVFNTDPKTGFNPVRTTSQVLQIVYGAAGKTGVSSGGFYPNGMSGNIKTS